MRPDSFSYPPATDTVLRQNIYQAEIIYHRQRLADLREFYWVRENLNSSKYENSFKDQNKC